MQFHDNLHKLGGDQIRWAGIFAGSQRQLLAKIEILLGCYCWTVLSSWYPSRSDLL